MNTDPLQQAKLKVSELINKMIQTISAFSPNNETQMKSLATELGILLMQKNYGRKGAKKSLLEYAFGDIEVPSVLSVEEVIENGNKFLEQRHPENIPPTLRGTTLLSTTNGLYEIINFANSFVIYHGLPKISVKTNEWVTLNEFLATNIMMIRHVKDHKILSFSVGDVIEVIRNKEASHYDATASSNPKEPFYTLYNLEDRHFTIRGIAEYVIAIYELLKGECKSWLAIEDISGNISFHVRIYSLDPIGICGPFISGHINKKQSINFFLFCQLFRNLEKGESYPVAQVTSSMRVAINDKHQLISQFDNDKDDVVLEHQIVHLLSEEEGVGIKIKAHHDTAKLLSVWHKWEASIKKVSNAEEDLINIPDSFRIKLLWIKVNALHNLKRHDEGLPCYVKLIELLNLIDTDQLNLSLVCHRNIGRCVFNITEICLSQNNLDDAVYFLEKLVESYSYLCEKEETVHHDLCEMVAYALTYLADIYADKGDKVNVKKVLENLAAMPSVTKKMAEWKMVAVNALAQLKNEG